MNLINEYFSKNIINILNDKNVKEINYSSTNEESKINILFDIADDSYNCYKSTVLDLLKNNEIIEFTVWSDEITIVLKGRIYVNW